MNVTRPSPSDVQAATPTVDLSRYSGAEKAAIILMALGEDAKGLWSVMDEDEIKEVSQAMASLGMVPSVVVKLWFTNSFSAFPVRGRSWAPSSRHKAHVAADLAEGKSRLADGRNPRPGRPQHWDKLANVHESVLASYLKNEYPQTVAVVLARFDPNTLRRCSPSSADFAAECIMRMLAMEQVRVVLLKRKSRRRCASSCRTWRAPRSATATSSWLTSSTTLIARQVALHGRPRRQEQRER